MAFVVCLFVFVYREYTVEKKIFFRNNNNNNKKQTNNKRITHRHESFMATTAASPIGGRPVDIVFGEKQPGGLEPAQPAADGYHLLHLQEQLRPTNCD